MKMHAGARKAEDFLGNLAKRLCTPLGGATMLLVAWLPWAHIECRSVVADPTLWALAKSETGLYIFPLLGGLMLALGLITLWRYRRSVTVAAILVGLAGAASWLYVLVRHRELAMQQATLQGMGERLAELLRDVQVDLGLGYILYLAGIVVALVGAFWRGIGRDGRPTSASGDP